MNDWIEELVPSTPQAIEENKNRTVTELPMAPADNPMISSLFDDSDSRQTALEIVEGPASKQVTSSTTKGVIIAGASVGTVVAIIAVLLVMGVPQEWAREKAQKTTGSTNSFMKWLACIPSLKHRRSKKNTLPVFDRDGHLLGRAKSLDLYNKFCLRPFLFDTSTRAVVRITDFDSYKNGFVFRTSDNSNDDFICGIIWDANSEFIQVYDGAIKEMRFPTDEELRLYGEVINNDFI